ncbi:hypothetical protein RB195_013789 [Necator americanus]|uniref:Uncharacterized protein n=1 Tax=Necator americanus TaxID=51031 RepID=A0ABR1DX69_NECAM
MPFEFLLSNHNITRDDVMRFSAKDAIRNGYWSHEELQLIVLGSLLLFIIFTFVMVATMDCVKQHCCKCLWRQRVGDKWKGLLSRISKNSNHIDAVVPIDRIC